MGRKRKTRWRRLSIGEVSGNEDEEQETEVAPHKHHHHKSHSLNSIHRHRSASQSSITNSNNSIYLDKATCTSLVNSNFKMSTLNQQQPQTIGSPVKNPATTNEFETGKDTDSGNSSGGTQSQEEGTSSTGSGTGERYHRHNSHYYHNSAPHYNNSRGAYHHAYHRYNSYNDKDRHSSYNGGHHPNEYSHNYSYHRSHSYNGYRNHYEGANGHQHHHGGFGGRGGGSEYYFPRAFSERGRFRKPRPFSYNYYDSHHTNNGSSHHPSSTSSNGETNNLNTPSYNQDEYTKITTPRQDVLFKKGYLSQRKPVTQSSSLESTSTATTPTTSTNGTPDTHSTTGINSDYSEGYETENGLPPQSYDDTLYYGPPAEAVFTDPNTGQVYYGQCSSNGEYFDAYPVSPVMLAGYPGSVFYQLAAYPGMDWNGVPQMIPVVAAPMPCDETVVSSVQGLENGDSSSSMKYGKKKGEQRPPSPPSSSASTSTVTSESHNSKNSSTGGEQQQTTTNGEIAEEIHSDSKSSSSSNSSMSAKGKNSSPSNSTLVSRLSSKASTPLSPDGNQQKQHFNNSLPTLMSNLSINNSPHHYSQQQQPHGPIPNYMAHVPSQQPTPVAAAPHQQRHNHHHQQNQPSHHHQQQQHHGPPTNSPYLIPHPSGFVYAPAIYNGVVVPIAPAASATTTTSDTSAIQSSVETSSSCASRKKRKKGRRKKEDDEDKNDDDGQLTDESFEDSEIGGSNHDLINDDDDDYDSKANKPQEPITNNPAAIHSSTEVTNENESTFTNALTTSSLESSTEGGSIPSCAILNNPKSETRVKINCAKEEESNLQTFSETTNVNQEPSCSALSKKPINLPSLNPVKCTGENPDLFSLQISPTTLEPGSPDSFNTTQSVAGSEIPSVAESDLMNRTTSLDEVEEDLPAEDDEENSKCIDAKTQPTGFVQRNISTPSTSNKLFITESSQDQESPTGSNENTPSPEASFENILEASFAIEEPVKSVRIPLENLYFPPQDSSTEDVKLEKVKEVFASTNTEPVILQSASEIPASAILRQPTEKSDLQLKEKATLTVESDSPGPERPKSITLAVTEWLKTQGEDALTPASQLIAQFAAAEAHDGDIDDDGESDDEEIDQVRNTDDLEESEQNQKNVLGNPWVVVSSNKRRNKKNTSDQRNTATYYKDSSRIRDNRQYNNYNRKAPRSVSRDGTSSRVASSITPSNRQQCPNSAPTGSTTSGNVNYKPRNSYADNQYKRDYRTLRERSNFAGHNRPPLLKTQSLSRSISTNDEDSGLDLSSPEHLASPVVKIANYKSFSSGPTRSRNNSNRNRPTKSTEKDKSCDMKPLSSASSTAEEEFVIMASNDEIHRSSSSTASSETSCYDPQKYTKYYQFGVVVEEEGEADKEKDQGVDLESPPMTPTVTPPGTPITATKAQDHNLNCTDSKSFDQESEETSRTKVSKQKKKKKKTISTDSENSNESHQPAQSISSISLCSSNLMKKCDFPVNVDLGEDEEIGTYDPQLLRSKKNSIPGVHSFGLPNESSTPPEIIDEDYKEFVQSVSKASPNLYVNPLSLAAELVYTANAKKVKLPDSWDLDTTESPLPIYESPPPPNLLNYPPTYSPVFSHLTPREKLIRTQLPPYGCCSALTSAATGTLATNSSSPVCCTIQ